MKERIPTKYRGSHLKIDRNLRQTMIRIVLIDLDIKYEFLRERKKEGRCIVIKINTGKY